MKRKQLSKNDYLRNAVDVINDYIKKEYSINPSDARENNQSRWKLQEGSAIYFVELYEDSEDNLIFEVSSPILLLPETKRELLYKRLLELNASDLHLSRFEISDDIIYLRHTRHIDDLDDSEIHNAIQEVSKLADDFDNKLQDEFGCELYSDWLQKQSA